MAPPQGSEGRELSVKAAERLAATASHLTTTELAKRRHLTLSELPRRRIDTKPRLVCSSVSGPAPLSHSHQLSRWTSPPTSVLVVHKQGDSRLDRGVGRILKYIAETYSDLRIIVEDHTAHAHPSHSLVVIQPDDLFASDDEEHSLLYQHTDLVITLGGDGTILHVNHLFSEGECPPVLAFSLGSLGFLLPFHIDSFVGVLRTALEGPVSILYRMRLTCTLMDSESKPLEQCARNVPRNGWQVMNEVALYRGRQPHLAVLDVFLNDEHLTEAIVRQLEPSTATDLEADGLLVSTPTGSTAYNLSSGGPISHPESDAILLTPVAPRSLSFRSVVLPGAAVLRLQIAARARAPAILSLDGRDVGELSSGESVRVARSPYPIPCIERGGGPGKGWVKDINSLLLFNTNFVNKNQDTPKGTHL